MAMKSMFDDELILPGVITEIINDYIAGYDTSEFGTTDAVTILGTAFNGPVGVPVPVFSPEYAKYMYGEAFDFSERLEATLIPEIYDAWDRGCRTIYAVRVSGKDMYKDFELAVETDLMLRVAGQFPCNDNKDCYMVFDSNQSQNSNLGSIKIYKPADRTTVQEKLQGVVNNINSILVCELKLTANDITRGTRLIELINKVNSLENNNVITLSLVNREGIAMTEADREVQQLNVGDMFPGIYTFCRDKVGEDIDPNTLVEIVQSTKVKPYSTFKDAIWKKLSLNTDVKQPFPLFAAKWKDFQNSLTNIVADSDFEFLKKIGVIDRIAIKNDIDYEEVDLDPFDLYQRLGKGFVKQAKLEKIEKIVKDINGEEKQTVFYKVVQPLDDDPNRVVGINDGIYSILENHKSDYIVLAGVSAETVINNGLPRKANFQVIKPNIIDVLDVYSDGSESTLQVECLMDSKDFSRVIDYDISIKNVEEFPYIKEILNQEHILENLHDGQFIRMPIILHEYIENQVVFEDINEDMLALAIDVDVNTGTQFGQLVRFNTKEQVFQEVKYDLLGIGQEGLADYKEPKLLVQVHDSLKVYKHIRNGQYELDNNPLDLALEDDGTISQGSGFIVATSGSIANVYYVPPVSEDNGTDGIASLLNALRDKDGKILTDDDNGDGDYDQGVDCILTYKLNNASITPLISLKDLAEGKLLDDEFTVYCIEKAIPRLPAGNISENETFVGIFSNEMVFCSREEMCNIFNNEMRLNRIFKFMVTDPELALEELPGHLNGSDLNRSEDLIYDEDAYIPYTTTDNFARHLAQHCLYTQLKTYPTHGVIGCSKLSGINLSTISQRVNDICNFDFDLYAKKDNGNNMLDSDNMPYALGRCLSIVFTQYSVGTGSNYNYVSNGAGGYAGMISNLPVDRSSTNQPFNIDSLNFELSNYQLGRLNAKGIVCAKNTTGGDVVIVDGITQAPKTSAYRRLATSRTINVVDRVLRKALEPYIGLIDSLSTRNSMNTAIKSALTDLTGNIINDFKFKIYTDSSGGNLGIIRVDYVIVPLHEIREIRNRVEISDAV